MTGRPLLNVETGEFSPPPAVKWRADVLVLGEHNWATNALRFDTEAEALAYAHNLYSRWTGASKMRVVPDTTPDRERYQPGSEHPDWS